MSASDGAAWIAVMLFSLTAPAGWALRRFGHGRFALRMRPHYVLGYAVFAGACVHTALSMGATQAIGALNTRIALFALMAIALEVFVGLSLQAPGAYRQPLRRWHTAVFLSMTVLIATHIVLTL